MLQEILLSLSGVPSPIWKKLNDKNGDGESLQDYVSPPEQAMLANLSYISQVHIEVRDLTTAISTKHPSYVCRAVSSAIAHKHLTAFQRRIIEVESSILKGDPAHVGGYQIVPLSTLVADFTPWTRRLEWLRKVALFMKGTKSRRSLSDCTAAAILKFLEAEKHTGFTDLEDLVTHLLVVAQNTWMRSVTAWILYGHLPSVGRDDFMIQMVPENDAYEQYALDNDLIPHFVSTTCAGSILAIGNALRQTVSPTAHARSYISQNTVTSLLSPHLTKIKLLQYPLNSSLLESTMVAINESISYHALSTVLPRSKVVEVCRVLQEYMLLGRGEFAVALIENSTARVTGRQKLQLSARPVRKLGRVDDMVLKQAELSAILSKSWSDLITFQGRTETDDDVFETAKQYLRLKPMQDLEDNEQLLPLATLLPIPASLQFELPPSSPLQIFLPVSSIQQYSRICAYLLSIRRSQLQVSSLWKLTSHRRCHPTPLGPPASASEFGRRACKLRRNREAVRAAQMRKFWSSMSKSLFFLNELGSYLHGDIIGNSWKQFKIWLDAGKHHQRPKTNVDFQELFSLNGYTEQRNVESTSNFTDHKRADRPEDDPRSLAHAHLSYLETLRSALLIDNVQFLSSLKDFLELLDHFAALFTRLSTVWQGLDLQEDDGVMDAFTNSSQDEKDILTEMDRARTELEGLLEQLVKHIKDVEKAQDSNDLKGTITSISAVQGFRDDFVPWRARTLDRLIMKLDFLYRKEESAEDLVDDTDFE